MQRALYTWWKSTALRGFGLLLLAQGLGACRGQVMFNPPSAAATASPSPDPSASATTSPLTQNHVPVAVGQSVNVANRTPTPIILGASDEDSGDTLSYAVMTGPAHGTLSGTAPQLTYTAATCYSGPDSFTFKASDGSTESEIATVHINVAKEVINYSYTDTSTPYYNVSIYSDAQSLGGWNGQCAPVINVTVQPNVKIGATSVNWPAFRTHTKDPENGDSFPAGTEINIVNNGFIAGVGGAGGSWGTGGSPGGDAIWLLDPVSLVNNGVIGGGGGGGGGWSYGDVSEAGGGGAGVNAGPGGTSDTSGDAGTALLGGTGGGSSGKGGDLGYNGQPGDMNGWGVQASGGGAGWAIVGSDLILSRSGSGSYLGHNTNTFAGSSSGLGYAVDYMLTSSNLADAYAGYAKGDLLNSVFTFRITHGGLPLQGFAVSWTSSVGATLGSCDALTDANGNASCHGLTTAPHATSNTVTASFNVFGGGASTTYTTKANSVCTGAPVYPGSVCTGTYAGAIYIGDYNGYEYISLTSDASLSTLRYSTSAVVTGATDLDDGQANMATLRSYYGSGFAGAAPAANACYTIGDNGWYLPTKNEFFMLRASKDLLGMRSGFYWTSSEISSAMAYAGSTVSGVGSRGKTNTTTYVHCLRRL